MSQSEMTSIESPYGDRFKAAREYLDKIGFRFNYDGLRHPSFSLPNKKLVGASFKRAHLPGANFSGCDLKGANFNNANLNNVNFNGADLRGATFENADITLAHFDGTDIRDVDLSKAEGEWCFPDMFASAIQNGSTTLPEDGRVDSDTA